MNCNSQIIPLNEYHVINTAFVVGNLIQINDEDIVQTTIPTYYSAGQAFGMNTLSVFSFLSFLNEFVFDYFELNLKFILFGFCVGVGLMLVFHIHLIMVADHFKPKQVLEALEQYMHIHIILLRCFFS